MWQIVALTDMTYLKLKFNERPRGKSSKNQIRRDRMSLFNGVNRNRNKKRGVLAIVFLT